MTNQTPELDIIKAYSWSNAAVSFYVAKRRLVQRQAHYEVLLVNVDQDVQKKLHTTLTERLHAAAGLMEYDFHTVDQDDNLLTLPTNETDFQQIIDIVMGENPLPLAQSQEQIFDVWFYVARFDLSGQPPLWAVRRTPKGWATKKKQRVANLIFSSDMQLKIDQREIFKIDDHYDFFSFCGRVFIFHKSAFETDMNFRESIIRHRTDLVAEFEQLGMFQTTEDMNEMIGNNMRLLRKAAQVKRLGYFRDQAFLEKLRLVNAERNLRLEYNETGKLIVSAERIDFILHLFTNGRLASIINHEVFDVDAKRKVNG